MTRERSLRDANVEPIATVANPSSRHQRRARPAMPQRGAGRRSRCLPARSSPALATPLLACLLLPLSALLATPAEAQTVLVQNINKSTHQGLNVQTSNGIERRYAQKFTTGTNANGYALDDVALNLTSVNASAVPLITIAAANGNDPGTTLYTMTNPSSIVNGTRTFTAPAGAELDASTDYFVVVRNSATGGTVAERYGINFTQADGEDNAGLTDWSIADVGRQKGGSGNWADVALDQSIKMRVRGSLKDTTTDGPTLAIGANSDGTGDATGNEGDTLSLIVNMSESSTSAVTVKWRYVSGGTASSSDYSHDGGTSAQNLSIAAGQTGKTVSIDLVNDDRHEVAESFEIELYDASGATISRSRVTITIQVDPDNPDLPTFTIAPTRSVDEEDGTVAVRVVHNAFASDVADITIGYQMVGITATAGDDFTAASGTLTFPKGSKSTQKIDIPILDDALAEPDETFEVRFGAPSVGSIVQNPAKTTVTILDIDPENTPATGTPGIDGAPQVGQTLTATAGNMADGDNLPTTTFPMGYSFQWVRVDGSNNETDIGTDSHEYDPVAADVGNTIKVEATFTDGGGTEETLTSDETEAVVAAPGACLADNDWCAIMTVGSYTLSPNTWYGFDTGFFDTFGSLDLPGIAYAEGYRVRTISIVAVAGGTRFDVLLTTFAPRGTVFDIGGTELTADASSETTTLGGYQWTSTSDPGWLVGQKVTVSANMAPIVTGATVNGTTLVLTFAEDLDTNSKPAASAFSVTVAGTAAAPSSVDTISGKTVTMTLATAVTSGQTVTVSYTVPTSNPLQDTSGIEAPAFSGQTVTNNTGATNTAATGMPEITGTPQSGQTLTATIGDIIDAQGLTTRTFPDDYTFKWFRDGGVHSGATEASLGVTDADVGSKFKVQVSFTDDAGNSEGPLESAETAAVVRRQESCSADRPNHDWCTTLTVELEYIGSTPNYGYRSSSGLGSLDNTVINQGGTSNTVEELFLNVPTVLPSMVFNGTQYLPLGTIANFGGRNFIANSATRVSGDTGRHQWDQPSGFAWLDGQKVTVSVNLPPLLDTATVDGDELVLTYFEDLDDTSTAPATSAYSVKIDGGTGEAPTGVNIDGKTVTLTLATAAASGQTVTVSYTRPTSNPLQDESGRKAAALTDEAVTNNTPAAPGEVLELLNTTLTVRGYGKHRGCNAPNSANPCTDLLDDRTFVSTDGGGVQKEFTIRGLQTSDIGTIPDRGYFGVNMYIWFEGVRELRDYEVHNLVVELDGRQFRFRNADAGGYHLRMWHDTGLQWSRGDDVAVRILDLQVANQVALDPLTAEFQNAPLSHDGSGAFTFRLAFSEDVDIDADDMRDSALTVSGATVTAAARVDSRDDLWEFTLTPSGTASVGIIVAGNRACTEAGALCTSDGRMLSQPLGLSLPYAATPALPGLSISDAEVQEAPNARLVFTVTLSEAADDTVTVQLDTADDTATAGQDYHAKAGKLRTFAPGETSKIFRVRVIDDAINEGTETMFVRLSNATNATIADGTGIGTIQNSDPLPKAVAVRIAREIGSQLVEAVGSRLDGGRETQVTVGGISVTGGGAIKEPDASQRLGLPEWDTRQRLDAQTKTVTSEQLLRDSSFSFSSGTAGPGSTAVGAWGHVATGRFDAEEDDITLDGDVTSGFLGADLEWDQALAGVIVSHSKGDGGYTGEGDIAGEFESTLTGIYPYARVDLGERVAVWGLAGGGQGEFTLRSEGHSPIKTDQSMRVGAVGLKGRVLEPADPGGLALDMRTDAMWVQSKTEATDGLVATEADASRVRLIVEGERVFDTGAGGTISPTGQVGVRYDGGDAETGAGLELGAGLRYQQGPLTLEGQVRGLVAHEESGYKEWGAGGSIRVQPSASGRGLSLSLAPVWGEAPSGAERLWSARDARDLDPTGSFEPEARLEAEVGYGLRVPHTRSLLTPYAGLTLAGEGSQTVRTGARWDMAPGAQMGLEGTRTADDNHGAQLRLQVTW